MERAYSVLSCKAMTEDDEYVYVEGMASTPTPDRMNDSVDPMGAKFKTPMPLLWQHAHDKPIGQMTFAKASREGIPFKAQIPKIREEGKLKERVDEAIHSLKYKLISAVSIGFSVMKDGYEQRDDGGWNIKSWEWLELSLVTIPANAEAIITAVKSVDQANLPASGLRLAREIEKTSPGGSGKVRKPILLNKRN